MKKIKFLYLLLLTGAVPVLMTSQVDQTSLWIFRMEQYAKEQALFEQLQGNRDGAATSAGLFSKNDTLKYASGVIFRTCEVSHSMLNGVYKMFYPSGKIYFHSIYKNNTLTDSSLIYSDKGHLESLIYYPTSTTEKQVYFDANNIIKKIEFIESIPAGNTTFNSGYVHTNTVKRITTSYFKSDGTSISKKDYYKLYPQEKISKF